MASSFIPTPVFSLSDAESIRNTDLTQCSLLMSVGADQLCYTIYNPGIKNFIHLKGYYFNAGNSIRDQLNILEKCFDSDKIIFRDFSRVKIMFDHPFFTFVPAAYYSKELKEDYIGMLIPPDAHQSIHRDLVSDGAMINIYATDQNLLGYLNKEFNRSTYFHSETVFLQSVLKTAEPPADRIYVRLARERAIITVVIGYKPHLIQSYPVRDTSDILYYTLNAIQRFKLPVENTNLYVSGEAEETTALYRELQHEIPGARCLSRSAEYHFAPPFASCPDHYFYTLTALAACE